MTLLTAKIFSFSPLVSFCVYVNVCILLCLYLRLSYFCFCLCYVSAYVLSLLLSMFMYEYHYIYLNLKAVKNNSFIESSFSLPRNNVYNKCLQFYK